MSLPDRLVPFTLVELLANLRHMRAARDHLRTSIRELQERARMGHNGEHNAATVVLDSELVIVEDVVRKLWSAYGATGPP